MVLVGSIRPGFHAILNRTFGPEVNGRAATLIAIIFLASLPAPPRNARVTLRVKRSAELIDRMADDMRAFGEGMTRQDLRRLGYTDSQIDACAEAANRRALSRAAGLN